MTREYELPRRAFGLLFCVQMMSAIGTTGLVSVVPIIGRSLDLPDYQIAMVFSLSAVACVIVPTFWARASHIYGRKAILLVGLWGFLVSMLSFAAVVGAGMKNHLPPLTLLLLLLTTRAVAGLVGSSAGPAAVAILAENTKPNKRTYAMSMLAGATGLGMIVGPFMATILVLPVVGLAGPMIGFGLLYVILIPCVMRWLPQSVPPRKEAVAGSPGGNMWLNSDVSPYLVMALIVGTAQIAQAQTLGFLIIDLAATSSLTAQDAIALAMMLGAVAGLVAQWAIVRIFTMQPGQMLRWGIAAAAAGSLIVAWSDHYWTAAAGNVVACLGFGLTRPGYSAGASLAVDDRDQARVAAILSTIIGINALVAPLFVWLYEIRPSAPFALNVLLLSGMLGLSIFSPHFRMKN